eukprot:CAMPEP_0173418670 /NCGR_PEP_ID=MMETSP1357-20121228/750_1 /TAXON_ID=77926 /ORGANISM="Hemiselmis rufescens, Strain PCC563" /LENGTH=97 /DNA_ID=CAMNT_0014381199 /DNA_START=73 /DNA_END=363 /DNA_ORIENTATION=-
MLAKCNPQGQRRRSRCPSSLPDATKRKLASVYIGPFDVLSASGNTVTLDLPKGFPNIHPTINVEYVRPYYPLPDWQPTTLVAPLIVQGQQQHLVDQL